MPNDKVQMTIEIQTTDQVQMTKLK